MTVSKFGQWMPKICCMETVVLTINNAWISMTSIAEIIYLHLIHQLRIYDRVGMYVGVRQLKCAINKLKVKFSIAAVSDNIWAQLCFLDETNHLLFLTSVFISYELFQRLILRVFFLLSYSVILPWRRIIPANSWIKNLSEKVVLPPNANRSRSTCYARQTRGNFKSVLSFLC